MKILLYAALALGLATLSAAPARAQEAPTSPVAARPVADAATQQTLDRLLDAIQNDKYADYLMLFDERLRPTLTKAAFEHVVQSVGPRLAAGYKATYLDQLKRQGAATHLWKLEFGDGDDVLVELSLANGKVVGFFLR